MPGQWVDKKQIPKREWQKENSGKSNINSKTTATQHRRADAVVR